MGSAVDYAERAAECRRLAAQYTKPEDCGHLIEMAETWEMLLKHQQEELKHRLEKSRLQTIALADQFRNVLLLSDFEVKSPAQVDKSEKAA